MRLVLISSLTIVLALVGLVVLTEISHRNSESDEMKARRIIRKNYAGIHVGMSQGEVEDLLSMAKADGPFENEIGGTSTQWCVEDLVIIVNFDSSRLVSSHEMFDASNGDDADFFQRLAEWLPLR